jgi:LysM repeat protein
MTPGHGERPRATRQPGALGVVLGAGLLLSACAGSVLDTTPSENPIPTTTPEVTIAEVVTPTTLPPAAPRVYVVAAGDTLSGIAERFGTTAAAIIELNDMDDPDNLSIGDELLVPAPEDDPELFAPETSAPSETTADTQ